MTQQQRSGLVHLYCGDGKGKTTAAVGLIVRALGQGFRVMMVQFLKSGRSGEVTLLRQLPGIEILAGQVTHQFSNVMTEEERAATRALHLDFFHTAVRRVREQAVDLLVLDEILGAILSDTMPEDELISFLDKRPNSLEVVLTGRKASDSVMQRADYISEIRCVRHPYERGIKARKGIEY